MCDREAYEDAHRRYQGFRDAVFDLTWNQVQPLLPDVNLKLMPIDDEALDHARHHRSVHPDGGFPWDAIFRQVRSTPRRFDIAIWDGNRLGGLAVGMASRASENVTIKWVERFRSYRDPLKKAVAPIAVTAAEHYAALLGKRVVLLRAPLAGVIPIYEELGFSLAPKRFGCLYMTKPID